MLPLLALVSVVSFLNKTGEKPKIAQQENQQIAPKTKDKSEVLGNSTRPPEIFISGSNQGYSSGGVISLASTDEPAVVIGGYNISGDVEITMYEADDNALLDYLTHDKDGKQTKKSLDTSKFRYITNVKQKITGSYSGSKVPLPLGDIGIWYLKVKMGSNNADAIVIRSNIGILTKEGDNEFIFWGQNFKNKRSISDGVIKLWNLQDNRKELQIVSFNAEGIAKANLNAEADIALIYQNNDRALIPINLKYLNTGYNYSQFQPKSKLVRYFIFTDRPLYKQGDTVFFKAVLRDDDDARYAIPSGEALVKIYTDYEGKDALLERNFPISSDGTVSGEYKLPANGKVGYHTLSVSIPSQSERIGYWDSDWSSNTISFDVQFFRKPEFSIDVTTPKTELIASDKTSFTINGTYFSGQPLAGQRVKYTVRAADFYEYSYLKDQQNFTQDLSDDYRYGYWYGSNQVTEGAVTLDNSGQAEIDLDTKMSWSKGKTQVFSIEATIEDGSQNPSFARRNMIVFAGEYGIYRKDYSYGTQVNTPLIIPITLVPYRSSSVAGVNLTAKVHRTNWVSYQDPNQKYPLYRKEEEDLPNLSLKTDNQGNTTLTFTPTKIGSYGITIEGKDTKGNLISKIFYSYVSQEGQSYYTEYGNSGISISTDKQKYLPTDTVKFNIFSDTPDRDVFLSLERGRVNRFQVVRLNGKNGSVDVPLVNTDMPNIFAEVSSFSPNSLDSNQTKLIVSPESKKVVVGVTPNSKTFGPGETVNLNISTTDIGGNPLSADVAVWAVDKAIFELSDNKLGNIFKTFWQERYNSTQQAHSLEGILVRTAERGGGCFLSGTKVLMADGTLKNIDEVKAGEYILTRKSETDKALVKAKVLKTHQAEEGGYLIINGNLKVTANHIIWINNSWKEAGSIQIGDILTDSQGKELRVSSVEWQRSKVNVYNLEVEKYRTFFAGGVWVHNQKGGERQTFKDTAYWNSSVHTDTSGRAQVSFKLPDNLTTWTLAAVAANAETQVGQTTSEITVTKDIIVRPILPNILREGDEAVLSALVQNFTTQDQIFDIGLKFDSGEIEEASQSAVQIPAGKMQQFYWKVKPNKENDKASLIFSAKVKGNNKLADIVTQVLPVRAFGFAEKRAQVGEGPKTFDLQFAGDSHKDKSKATLFLSPTIIGALPAAMKYLIDYPYGCVEQTTSRFVPAVIAKMNTDLFAEALKDKDIDDIIEKGVARLTALQLGDGGWTWWYQGKSDPFITAYVMEYLLAAKQAGVKVDEDLRSRATSYLKLEKYYDYNSNQEKTFGRDEQIAKAYALILSGEKDKVKKITDLNNISPDLLAYAVMVNYLKGDTNQQSNGLSQLISMAQTQGDGAFWETGNKLHFGSKDASTALAIRAIVLAGGDRNLAAKGVRFLTRTRQSNYWSNTFATAQVVRALVEFSKTGEEFTPNYTYSVTLDGKQVAQGTVTNSKQSKEINIAVKDVKQLGSKLEVTKDGEGQIYSTLLIEEFHTDRNAKAVNRGLSIKRQYVNEKGSEYSLAVGDTVLVQITVGGLKASENYAVIDDELPAGLVPINESFKNEQYGNNRDYYYSSYDVTDREITENGMVMSLYQIAPVDRTYTYKARVISEGTFIVPPVTASLMYAPEISGRSETQTIKIGRQSQFTPKTALKEVPKTLVKPEIQGVVKIAGVLIIIGGLIILLKRRGVTMDSVKEKIRRLLKRNESEPPLPPNNGI